MARRYRSGSLLLPLFICLCPWFPLSARAASGQTLTGIDVLESQRFTPLKGKRIGLVTNQTGIDRESRSTIDLLAHAPGVTLVALFSPEHGLRGTMDERVSSSRDAATGLPVYSLYGDTLRPTDAMLSGIDALVFDIQDAGVRFYTYITTMGYAMEGAAAHRIPFYVLDRPDPIRGDRVEGPVLDPDRRNFAGYFRMSVRMGMTLGEMARMFNAEMNLGCDLHVIEMRKWRRSLWFDQTGLPWVNPSPNLRSSGEEALYPGIEILQAGGVSVGRGTNRPFELVGAPWIQNPELANDLNARGLSGVRFESAEFTPHSGLYKGERCNGARIVLLDRNALAPMRVGLEIASELAKLYPGKFEPAKMIELLGNVATVKRLASGTAPASIVASWQKDLDAFRQIRAKYLLYR